jgi:tight adherence protein B
VRRLAAALTVAAIAAVAACTLTGLAAAESARVPIASASASRFPDRLYALTLPSRRKLTAADIRITENGQPVNNLTVAPPGAVGSTTILLIDSSNSMRGGPIENALKAARAFADQRNPASKLGVIFFNKSATVALPPTRDETKIKAALASVPKTEEGTRIYDALGVAAQELRNTAATAGAVVLLTDGADVGSTSTEANAVESLAAARARVFGVGLRSEAYTPATLQSLSGKTGGTYAVAGSPNAHSGIFSTLGFKLANEYLVFYRSLERPSKDVNVAISIRGYKRVLHDSYKTPALGINTEPFKRSTWSKILVSWWFMFLMVILTITLLSWGLWTTLDARRRTLRARMSRFVELEPLDEGLSRQRLLERITSFATALESRGRFFRRFSDRCELANIDTPAGSLLIAAIGGGLLLGILLSAAISAWFLLVIPVPLFVLVRVVAFKLGRVKRKFADQLPDNLDVLASALRAGHSLVGAMTVMARDAAEPSKREFERVVGDEQLGIPLDVTLKRVGTRMDNIDMTQVALIALLQRETGSSSAEVIDQVADNVRARMEVRRLVRTLTAQGRLARWIVSLMPVGLLLAMTVIVPGYLHPLFHEAFGIAAVIVGTLMVFAGSYVIKRIVEIKV